MLGVNWKYTIKALLRTVLGSSELHVTNLN